MADQRPAAQVKLAGQLLRAVPKQAGLASVVFGSQEVADYARKQNAPFAVFSVEEAAAPIEEDDEKLSGPLLVMETSWDDAGKCQQVVEKLWTGKVVLVVNAEWLRDEPPVAVSDFAQSLNAVYYFLPVTFGVCSDHTLSSRLLKSWYTGQVARDG